MNDTIEAIVDRNGNLRPLVKLDLPEGQHVRITVQAEDPSVLGEEWTREIDARMDQVASGEVELLPVRDVLAEVSEWVLAKDWDRREEDEAWAHLQ